MRERNIWGLQPASGPSEEHMLMSIDAPKNPPNEGHPPRTMHVPVFRTGNSAAGKAITIDQRSGQEIFLAPNLLVPFNPARIWESLSEIRVTASELARNGLFPISSQSPVTRTFDVLRTRVLQAMGSRKWTRVAVTSPTHGCGKSFVASNLALSMARLPSCRTVLLDLELRNPSLARLFLQEETASLAEVLFGKKPLETHFRRFGPNLALGLSGEGAQLSSEILQDPEFANALAEMNDLLQPDVVIIDTPPALVGDEVLALASEIDAVLLVVDGTRTSPEEVRACERLLEGKVPLLGTVLNQAQDRALDRYVYGRRG